MAAMVYHVQEQHHLGMLGVVGGWFVRTEAIGGGWYLLGPYGTEVEAQKRANRFNLNIELARRKNAALDRALAAGVGDRELYAAIDSDDLLRYESLDVPHLIADVVQAVLDRATDAADAPHVVEVPAQAPTT